MYSTIIIQFLSQIVSQQLKLSNVTLYSKELLKGQNVRVNSLLNCAI